MLIRLKKGKDGPHTLVCVRSDGTQTMQHHPAEFFPVHDLAHVAVESVLRHRRGFYGLLEEGWDIKDFGTPWPRGKPPADADPTELIVGAFDLERGTGVRVTADDLNATMASYYAQHAPGMPVPAVAEAELVAIRARIKDLHSRWYGLAPGQTMELHFTPGAVNNGLA
jgi:hypothetical protein